MEADVKRIIVGKNFQWLVLAIMVTLLLAITASAWAKDIQTNSLEMTDAPDWVTRASVEKVIDHIQMVLEWTIRKIQVHWYFDAEKFAHSHSLGSTTLAYSRRSDNSVHLGPKVNRDNFGPVLGHELVHVILFQKYQEAVPKWLEEGLANHLARFGKVDYTWLKQQPFPKDVRTLVHPSRGSVLDVRYNYLASQALIEMISAKCDLTNLLRLSVERKLEDYLDTYCEIKDLNLSFKKWVQSHSSS